MAYNLIGKDFTPMDVEAKVTGRAKYAEDFRADNMAFCKTLTSPIPHAKIKSIDTSEALKIPGVLGILTADDGKEVFLRANALAPDAGEIKPGMRMEFGVADGRKGAQAMAAKILDRGPSVAKAKRMPARDLAPIVQDLATLLEHSIGSLTNGKYPEGDASKIAAALRKVADNFDA